MPETFITVTVYTMQNTDDGLTAIAVAQKVNGEHLSPPQIRPPAHHPRLRCQGQIYVMKA